MDIYNCLRCGHEWASRKIDRPERCAKCTAKYWWRARRTIKPKTSLPYGRPTKYPVGRLNIGQTMVLEYGRNVVSMKQSILAHAKRHGKQFRLITTAAGLKVVRVL